MDASVKNACLSGIFPAQESMTGKNAPAAELRILLFVRIPDQKRQYVNNGVCHPSHLIRTVVLVERSFPFALYPAVFGMTVSVTARCDILFITSEEKGCALARKAGVDFVLAEWCHKTVPSDYNHRPPETSQ